MCAIATGPVCLIHGCGQKEKRFEGMMMQEILIVIAIAAAVIFIPRLMKRGSSSREESRPAPQSKPVFQGRRMVPDVMLTGWMRLAIVVTLLWVTGTTIYMKPWEDNVFRFFLIGICPAIVLWGLIWAWFGYKKYRR